MYPSRGWCHILQLHVNDLQVEDSCQYVQVFVISPGTCLKHNNPVSEDCELVISEPSKQQLNNLC